MTMASDPVRSDELDELFAPLLGVHAREGVALAVSGGSDSTALMVLFADWLRQRGSDFAHHTVLTVDHRLRPESAAEARGSCPPRRRLGFRHATLVWEGAEARDRPAGRGPRGPLPADGRARARQRHRHAADRPHPGRSGRDAADAARPRQRPRRSRRHRRRRASSGLAAVAAPAARHPEGAAAGYAGGARHPLDRGPEQPVPAFERTRLRAPAQVLAALGSQRRMLAMSAPGGCSGRARRWTPSPKASAPTRRLVAHRPLRRLPHRPRAARSCARGGPACACSARCIAAAGGSAEPVPLGKLEPIVDTLCRGKDPGVGSWTLARALITAAPEAIAGRARAGPAAAAAPSSRRRLHATLWDGRFASPSPQSFGGTVEVRALGAEGLAGIRQSRASRQGRAGSAPRAIVLAGEQPAGRAGPGFLGKPRARGATFG